jgi:tetratricopeptide (TPR) repeat protein
MIHSPSAPVRRRGPLAVRLVAGFVTLAAFTPGASAARRPKAVAPTTPLAQRVLEDSLGFAVALPTGRFETVHPSLARDIAEARGAGENGLLTRLLRIQGVAFAMSGDGRQATPALDEGLRLNEARRDTSMLLTLLRWRTYVAGMLGRLDEQEGFARRLIAVAEADSNARFIAVGHNFLGGIARQRGDLKSARFHLQLAVERQRALHNEQDEAVALTAYGATLMDLGEYDAARRGYARQLDIARRSHNTWSEAQALNDLGRLENEVGDPARGVEYLRRAYQIHRARGETPDAAGALVNLASAELELGRAANAVDLAREGLAMCERHGFGRMRGSFLIAIATAEEQLGQRDAAEREWNRVMALADTATSQQRALAVMGLARNLDDSGREAEGLALVERAAPELLSRLGDADAAEFVVGLARRLYLAGRVSEAVVAGRRTLALAPSGTPMAENGWLTIAVAENDLGRPSEAKAAYDSAYAAWERRRSHPSDPEWRGGMWGTGGALRLDYAEFLLGWPAASPESTRIAAAFDLLQRFRARTLLDRMSGPRAMRAGSTGPSFTFTTMAELQHHLLGPGELALEWAVDDHQAWLFTITREGRHVFRLADARGLKSRIGTARGLLAEAPRGAHAEDAADAVARELARTVFGAALPLVERAHAILLVPDGPLNLVPFAALATRSGPLAASRRLAVVPSLTVLAEMRRRAAAGVEGHGLLAMASGEGSGPSLAGAVRELEWLAQDYEGVVRAGAGTDAPVSIASFGGYDALHFAGHTALDDRYPWRSGIDIGPQAEDMATLAVAPDPHATRESGGARELLRAETIATLPLRARLVVLSSCQSAAGTILAGEGVSGLSTAFLAAGARTVVASLWPVDDRATETLMREFYRGLASGHDAADALRMAQRHLWSDPGTRHPYYWAGFVLLGDGNTTVALRPTPFWHRGPGAKRL